MQYKKIIKR